MKPYSSYKDSRIEWISDIPEEWMIVPLKYQFKLVSGFPFDSDLLTIEESDLPVIRIGNVSSGRIDVFYQGDLNNNIPIVDTGDLIISLTGDFIVRIWNNKKSLLNQRCGLIRPIFNVNTKYLFYFLPETLKVMGDTKYFTTLKNLSNKEIESIRVLRPSPPEQQSIVSFLDLKTQQIDELIEKTEKKIELLKEKRTSLINHCVTKGLNPDVEMKDSGVEWIGDIPSHWEIKRLKYFSMLVSEKKETIESDIKISPENVESYTGKCFNLNSEYSGTGVPFQSGDILLNKLRLYLVKVLLPDYDGYSMGEMIVIRINKSLSNKFYFYLFFNKGLVDLLDSQSTGIKVPRVSPEVIINSYLPYPSPDEQQQIVDYLDEHTQKIDSTIEKETQRIELLKEYRQSLISEVVTGKIDVREWKQ